MLLKGPTVYEQDSFYGVDAEPGLPKRASRVDPITIHLEERLGTSEHPHGLGD
jgi:hypothetical protein